MDFQRIRILVLDVDGVLSDGRLFPVSIEGPGVAGFAPAYCVQDGSALQRWRRAGGRTAILSGRSGPWVDRRADELEIDWRMTGVKDKGIGFEELLTIAEASHEETAYVGDDVPDLPALARSGFPIAVANAASEVKRIAAYVTERSGGCGAVAEAVDFLLRKRRRMRAELSRRE